MSTHSFAAQVETKRDRTRQSNSSSVLDVLSSSKMPMTAYEILDAAKPMGIAAPPTVYRALDRLMKEGSVHRLESLNAYVTCKNKKHEGGAIFTICLKCQQVEEIVGQGLTDNLHACATAQGFRAKTATVEIKGVCAMCSEQNE